MKLNYLVWMGMVILAVGQAEVVNAADEPAPVAAKPDATNSTSTKAAAKPSSKPAAPRPEGQADKLMLDTTTVTGNRELPKVMYIVPWKKADMGQLPGQPFNSLVNEALQPLDREEFRRQVNYYQAIANKDQPSDVAAGK